MSTPVTRSFTEMTLAETEGGEGEDGEHDGARAARIPERSDRTHALVSRCARDEAREGPWQGHGPRRGIRAAVLRAARPIAVLCPPSHSTLPIVLDSHDRDATE